MYLPQKFSKLSLFIILISAIAFAAHAQSFDYQARPRFDFTYNSAQIDLRVNPPSVALKGSVLYNLTANINGADTLLLNAPGITIDSVQSHGKKLVFSKKKDRLQIALAHSSQSGKDYSVKIYYQAAPHFGLLKSSEGTVWTSMLPRSTRHWLPVRDNPRVRMNVMLSLRLPNNYKVFASGIIRDTHNYRDSTKKVTFKTGSPIPITSLAFGIGHFHGINSFAEPNSISSGEQQKLVRKTKQIIKNIKKITGMGYPFQRVTLAILNDDHWETKQYGASTVFLYINKGNLMTQLRRGLIAQWIGVYLNEGQWVQSWPIHFMQAALYNQLSDSAGYMASNVYDPKTPFSTVYDQFGLKTWNFWQEYKTWNVPNTKEIVEKVIPELLKAGPATITPETFKTAWYKISGQPQINLPSFHPEAAASTGSAVSDTIHYRVKLEPNKMDSTLSIVFNAGKDSMQLQQPITLPVTIISNGSKQNKQIRLSGTSDSLSIPLPAGVQNVLLQAPKQPPIAFEIHKPVSYSLYQLRNGGNPELQARAATQLGYHTDDPDLQLALVNAMKKNKKPDVQAALLQAYSNLTKGATGTQKRFLDALSSPHDKVQMAALEGLKNYKSESITGELKKFAENNSHADLAARAMEMYMQRVDSTTALNFANTLVQQDTSGTRAVVGAEALANDGFTKRAVQYAGFYMDPVYTYPVRKRALSILVAYDKSDANWNKRLKILMNDLDPRIRYLMAKNIDKIPVNADSILSSHQEYDARVAKGLQLQEAKF
jgi:hypothetical protein